MTGLEVLIIATVAALAIAVFIHKDKLTLSELENWIRQKGEIASKGEVGFILKEKIKNGNYKVVNGVFNKNTEEVVDYQAHRAGNIDNELRAQEDLVVYN